MLKIKGKTTDGKLVVSGVLEIYNRYGIPLTVIFEELDKKNYVIDWISLYEESQEMKWSVKGFFSRIKESVTDVYGKEYWLEIEKRYEIYFRESK